VILPPGYSVMTPPEVDAARTNGAAVVLLDVRTPGEFRSHRVPGARLLPVHELPTRWQELDPDAPTICICEHGIRSEAAADYLVRQGFSNVANMRGRDGPLDRRIERG
jgi:rhodanese-related sulfurtransferase